jgi:hypothetical protein
MNVARKLRNGCQAVVILTVLGPAAVASAKFPNLGGAGRICGFSWGDGYHACSDSGIRPGADNPPQSFSAIQRSRTQSAARQMVRFSGVTYYDQFDAVNHRRMGTPGTRTITTITNMHGSQVMQQPAYTGTPQPADRVNPAMDPSRPTRIGDPRGEEMQELTATSTPNEVSPVHPGDNPDVKPPYTTSEQRIKTYPRPLPSTQPPAAPGSPSVPASPPAPTSTPELTAPEQSKSANFRVWDYEGAIHVNPFVAGPAIGVAKQGSDLNDGVIRQPLGR